MKRILVALLFISLSMAGSAALGASDHPTAGTHRPGSILVRFRASTTAADRRDAKTSVGATRTGRLGFIHVQVLQVADVSSALSRLRADHRVRYAEENARVHATASSPNDSSFSQQYSLNNTGQTGGTADADIDAPEGWATAYGTTGGNTNFPTSLTGPVIGIIDTGFNRQHPDLAGKLFKCAHALSGNGTVTTGRCGDGNGHGTHVSGIASALTNNGQGVAGVAPNARIAMCKALGSNGSGFLADVDGCMKWLSGQGVAVISMSLGSSSFSSSEQATVNQVWNNGNGTLMVAAAGNSGNSSLNYPAAYANVVSVASTGNSDQHSSFSNANTDVEVSAPGENVLSTCINGGICGALYQTLSGTSMSTPHAAGAVAIIKLRHPTYTALQLRNALDAAVDDLGTAGRDSQFGFGRVNLQKAAL